MDVVSFVGGFVSRRGVHTIQVRCSWLSQDGHRFEIPRKSGRLSEFITESLRGEGACMVPSGGVPWAP